MVEEGILDDRFRCIRRICMCVYVCMHEILQEKKDVLSALEFKDVYLHTYTLYSLSLLNE